MGGRIMLIFIVVIALGVGLYIYNSGVIGKGIGFLNTQIPRQATTTTFIAPQPSTRPSYVSGGTVITRTPAPSIGPTDVPAGFTTSQLSPYFHQVRFGGISAGNIYSYGQISLYAYPATGATSIDVTGWHIKSNRGGEYIPQAVDVYDPTGNAPAGDIRLASGDMLNLYSTSAPVNLRINKCIGYLPNRTQFNPQLPQSCPYIDNSKIQSFSGACQNYIMSLGGCQSPDLSSPYVPWNDYACQDYLNSHFNYRSCFDEHRTDSDFLSHEIRVWMGSSPVDQFHDQVLLLDANGLLVDLYKY